METITSLLQLFNKPLHFLLVGAVVIFLGPQETVWLGYVLIAASAASGLEFAYSKFNETRKAKQKAETEKEKRKTKDKIAIQLYEKFHPREKYMVDACIVRNEWVFEEKYTENKKYITALVMKGFGQSQDFGRAIAFNGDKFLTILSLKGKEIIEEWEKKQKDDDEGCDDVA